MYYYHLHHSSLIIIIFPKIPHPSTPHPPPLPLPGDQFRTQQQRRLWKFPRPMMPCHDDLFVVFVFFNCSSIRSTHHSSSSSSQYIPRCATATIIIIIIILITAIRGSHIYRPTYEDQMRNILRTEHWSRRTRRTREDSISACHAIHPSHSMHDNANQRLFTPTYIAKLEHPITITTNHVHQ